MGVVNSKEYYQKRKIDQATSNTSLSKLRYITVEKPKWKVFSKKEVRPIPLYQTTVAPRKGCLCGGSSRCKQTVTPNGVTMHYPHKKRTFGLDKRYKPPNIDKGYLSNKDREINRVKIVRPKKFSIPTWRVDKMLCDTPFQRPKKCNAGTSPAYFSAKCAEYGTAVNNCYPFSDRFIEFTVGVK